jgi:hypothetical protein
MSITSHSTLTARSLYGLPNSTAIPLKMAMEMFAEKQQNLQQSAQLIPAS